MIACSRGVERSGLVGGELRDPARGQRCRQRTGQGRIGCGKARYARQQRLNMSDLVSIARYAAQ